MLQKLSGNKQKGFTFIELMSFRRNCANTKSAIPDVGSCITIWAFIALIHGLCGQCPTIPPPWGSTCVTFQRLFPKQDPGISG